MGGIGGDMEWFWTVQKSCKLVHEVRETRGCIVDIHGFRTAQERQPVSRLPVEEATEPIGAARICAAISLGS